MEDGDDTTAAWLMLGITIAFKVGLTLWILITFPSTQNLVVNAAINWPWLLLGVVVLVALVGAPVAFWVRRLRVRAKREKLLHAEWHVDPDWSFER